MSRSRGALSVPVLLLLVAALAAVAWLAFSSGLLGGGSLSDGGARDDDEARRALLEGRTTADGAEAANEEREASLAGVHGDAPPGGVRVRLLWVKDDAPVVGQVVRLLGVRGVHVADRVTDEEGRALFERILPGSRYTLHVKGEGFAEVLVRNVEVLSNQVTTLDDVRVGTNVVLTGRVVDPSGRPVAGATVAVFAPRTDFFRRGFLLSMLDMAVHDDVPLARATTGEDGRFAFATLESGIYRIEARAAGRATAHQGEVLVRTERSATTLTLVLDPGMTVRGTVTDDQGRPVANAMVRALYDGQRVEDFAVGRREGALTDAKGKYAIDTLMPNATYRFGVSADGHPSQWMFQSVRIETGMTKDFVLARAARVTGTVREKDSREPIADAEVVLMVGRLGEGSAGMESTRSDAQGRYTFDTVASGPMFMLVAKADGFSSSMESAFTGATLPSLVAGETLERDLELERGGRIVGRVTRLDDGEPIAGASVDAIASNEAMWAGAPSATTDADGRYELTGLGRGVYSVDVRAPGYAEALGEGSVPITDRGEQGEINVSLSGAARLVGVVVDADGEPVAGAKVYARSEKPDAEAPRVGGRRRGDPMQRFREQFTPRVTMTDEEGRFALEGLAPRLAWKAAVKAEGFVETESERVRMGVGDTREVRVVVLVGGALDGRVVNEDGQPVAGARVRYGRLDDELARRVNLTNWEVIGLLEPNVVTTRDDGTFRLTQLQPGLQVIQVEAEGYAPLIKRNVRVGLGEVWTGWLGLMRRGVTLRGRVLDTRGSPIERAVVSVGGSMGSAFGGAGTRDLAPEGGSGGEDVTTALFGWTEADGAFEIKDVLPGTYTFNVWAGVRTAEGRTYQPITQENVTIPGTNDFEFRLEEQEEQRPPLPPLQAR